MINVCSNCGLYSVKKIIDLQHSTVTCLSCHHIHPYIFKQLLIITGPSGAGKTTIHERLIGTMPGVILLDGDIFWNGKSEEFFSLVLRACKNIIQSNVHVVIFNSGLGVPSNILQSEESAYFSGFKYLNLTCSTEELIKRLKRRPEWRQSATDEELQRQIKFKEWLENEYPNDTIDTSLQNITVTADAIREWIIANTQEPTRH